MRTLPVPFLFFVVSFVAVTSPSQNLPFASSGINLGNPGGGFYFAFTCNTTVTWTTLNYVASTGSTAGNSSCNVWLGPTTWVGNVAVNPGPWLLSATTTPVAIFGGVDTPVAGVLSGAGSNPGATLTLEPGTYGVALEAVGHSWRYANGTATFSDSTISVSMGGASNTFLATPTFMPRTLVGSLEYDLGGPSTVAQVQRYGAGCYASYQSFYENFPSAAGFDLSNTSMYLVYDFANNRYSNIVAGGTPVQPPGSPSLGHGNDNNLTVNLLPTGSPQAIPFPGLGAPGVAATNISMCSNLYVTLSGAAPVNANPTVATWLTGGATRIGAWHNADPSSGGSTHYDYDVPTAAHLFTWLAVPDYTLVGSSNTFQLAFFANGDVEFRWGAMSPLAGTAASTLVGFTTGGALDPGNLDLSVRMLQTPPLATANLDRAPFGLRATQLPVRGSTFDLTAINPTGGSLGVTYVGFADLGPLSPAGIDLGPIGAPGCVMNLVLSASLSRIIGSLPGIAMTFPLPIPNVSTLVGQQFYSQSLWIDGLVQNTAFSTAGLLTSNALRFRIG